MEIDPETQTQINQLSADLAEAFPPLSVEELAAKLDLPGTYRQLIEMRDVHLPAMIAMLPPYRA